MAATNNVPALRLWAFGTFRAVTFVVSSALYLHLTDRLSGLLRSLNTELGLTAFLLLWATTLLATRTGLRRLAADESSMVSILMTATVAGAWNGLYVWAAILLVLLGMNLIFGTAAGMLILAVAGSVIGGALAFTIGAVFGFAYGIVDACLLQALNVFLSGVKGFAQAGAEP